MVRFSTRGNIDCRYLSGFGNVRRDSEPCLLRLTITVHLPRDTRLRPRYGSSKGVDYVLCGSMAG
jgi:hypothetical protein